jgi:PPIC-type PPIASE domain
MESLRRLLREPLVHFVAAGGALFLAYMLIQGDAATPADATAIVIDRRSLLAFMQYRANAFEPSLFAAALDGMSPTELDELIDAYVDDEIMFRQAKELGLGESDYVIRQRMIQKADFLLGDVASASVGVDDAALRAYFEANKEAYSSAPTVTFAHVFFDADRHGGEAAHAAAEEAASALTASGAHFEDATGKGDHFPFLTNYVERTLDYVASHFGSEFAATLATLTPSASTWQGPIRSAYGEHVVLLIERAAASDPAFEDVRDNVERDYLDARSRAERARMLDGLRGRYRVQLRDLHGQ